MGTPPGRDQMTKTTTSLLSISKAMKVYQNSDSEDHWELRSCFGSKWAKSSDSAGLRLTLLKVLVVKLQSKSRKSIQMSHQTLDRLHSTAWQAAFSVAESSALLC